MTEFIALLILFAAMVLIVFIGVGISELIFYILHKRRQRWCKRVLENYPELKVLLSEYRRLRMEHSETVRDAYDFQKEIDVWVEKNKYLPLEKRVDDKIEELKKLYSDLLDIQAEQSNLADKAHLDLINFWETNFPELSEQKRIMWWGD